GLMMVALLVFLYAIIRFVEATGLWLEKPWAEWFALISGGLYIPVEVFELARRPTPIKWIILGVNLLIVLYLVWLLRGAPKAQEARKEGAKEVEEPTAAS